MGGEPWKKQEIVDEGRSSLGFKARERKRQAKAARAQVRREHGPAMRARYYRTMVQRDCRCSACGARLRAGSEMVYRKDGPVTLCLACATRDPLVEVRVSLRWEREQAKRAERARRRAQSAKRPEGDERVQRQEHRPS